MPVLWDTADGRIVNNESSDIIRMLYAPDSLGALGTAGGLDLYPQELRAEIDAINERVYDTVNNGVYRAGFARLQGAYERAFRPLFDSFDWLEELLGARRYLRGRAHHRGRLAAVPDARALRRGLQPALPLQPPPARRLPEPVGLRARAPPVAGGRCARSRWTRSSVHYYTTHDELNPKRIIPRRPRL